MRAEHPVQVWVKCIILNPFGDQLIERPFLRVIPEDSWQTFGNEISIECHGINWRNSIIELSDCIVSHHSHWWLLLQLHIERMRYHIRCNSCCCFSPSHFCSISLQSFSRGCTILWLQLVKCWIMIYEPLLKLHLGVHLVHLWVLNIKWIRTGDDVSHSQKWRQNHDNENMHTALEDESKRSCHEVVTAIWLFVSSGSLISLSCCLVPLVPHVNFKSRFLLGCWAFWFLHD